MNQKIAQDPDELIVRLQQKMGSFRAHDEILTIANPIMDNLMEGSTEINHEKHTRDFTDRMKKIVTKDYLDEEEQARDTGYTNDYLRDWGFFIRSFVEYLRTSLDHSNTLSYCRAGQTPIGLRGCRLRHRFFSIPRPLARDRRVGPTRRKTSAEGRCLSADRRSIRPQ